MTALCPGSGPSALKQGAGAETIVSASLITAGLLALSPWLAPVAALVDGFVYEALTQCTSDPPAMPTFDLTDAEILALGLLAPSATTTLSKIHDVILIFLWHQYCVCTGGSTPPPPTPVAPPGGANTGGPQGAQPCFTGGTTYTVPVANPPLTMASGDITQQVLPVTGVVFVDNSNPSDPQTHYGIPTGVTSVHYQSTQPNTSICGGSSGAIMGTIQFFDSTHTHIPVTLNQFSGPQYPAPQTSGTILVPSTAVEYFAVSGFSPPSCGTVAGPAVTKTQVYCGGGGPGVLGNCCPPDPSIMFALNNLLQLVTSLAQSIPTPITSYADSTVHGGLSGSGNVTLGAGAIAFRVNLTTVPPGYGATTGTPNYFFDLGWVTPAALSEPFTQQRVAIDGQVFVLPAVATEVFYTLNQGVVISITELVRGP